MKLELKHLAPYLPYGLKYIYVLKASGFFPKGTISYMSSLDISLLIKNNDIKKPILRPLSDLIALIDIDFEDEKFKPVDVIIRKGGCRTAVGLHVRIEKGTLGFKYLDLLLQWHFDVFGLIEKGLAIDINTMSSLTTN
jgi:energy-converting hydrogenase A subunit M